MSASEGARVLVDVTQYVNCPAASGVQRVIRQLAENWSGRTVDPRFGFIEDGRFVTGPFTQLGSVMASAYWGPRPASGATLLAPQQVLKNTLRRVADDVVPVTRIDDVFRGYLLPEPTFRDDSLAIATRLAKSSRAKLLYIYYDAFPLTHPQYFPDMHDGRSAITRYHRAVAAADNVAFISRAVRDEYEKRIARRRPANAVVVRPGADGLPRPSKARAERPTFAMLGTVEPRKGHRVVVDAFERLWLKGRDYRLVILGAPGSERAKVVLRQRAHSRADRLTWIDRPDDESVADTLASAWAMIFPSEAEGYGLPPLEAMAVGCPVVVSGDLPSLEGLPSDGQIRLSRITSEAVASAVETLADPDTNATYRRALTQLRFATWRQFADEVERWITSVLNGSTVSNAGASRLDREE